MRKDCGYAAETVRKDYGSSADKMRCNCGPAADAMSKCTPGPPYLCETKIRNGKPGFEASGSLVSRVSLPAREILAPPIKRNEYAQTHDCAASLDCVLK